MNNAEFVEGLRNQDPIAAKHLTECFVPSVWRFVYFRVDGDRHLAEDIVSESVLALVVAVGQGVAIEHPSAWLRCVALRKLQDHFRAVARVQHLIEQAGQSMSAEEQETPATEHDKKIKREAVRSAIDRLPEMYRLALEWKYIERLSVREIGRRLDATEKGAESILFRARKRFRTEFRKEDPADPPSKNVAQTAASDEDEDDENRWPVAPNEVSRIRS